MIAKSNTGILNTIIQTLYTSNFDKNIKLLNILYTIKIASIFVSKGKASHPEPVGESSLISKIERVNKI